MYIPSFILNIKLHTVCNAMRIQLFEFETHSRHANIGDFLIYFNRFTDKVNQIQKGYIKLKLFDL